MLLVNVRRPMRGVQVHRGRRTWLSREAKALAETGYGRA
jgi:hypothetical protein